MFETDQIFVSVHSFVNFFADLNIKACKEFMIDQR
jgi:hypothetical protein